MGQYYKICNADTFEYFSPRVFGEGVKLMEFGSGGSGSLAAIAALLALPSADERGSWTGTSEKQGAWAGKRLVVSGDYADEGNFVPPAHQELNLYSYCEEHGVELSEDLIKLLVDVAGPTHPCAAKLLAAGRDSYFFEAPSSLIAYLDTSKADQLVFESLSQLMWFGWHKPSLEPEKMSREFSEALRFIGLKFQVKGLAISDFKMELSEDSMRVQSVRFTTEHKEVHWKFPLKVSKVYKLMGIQC